MSGFPYSDSTSRPIITYIAMAGLALLLGCGVTHPYPIEWAPIVRHKPGEQLDLAGYYHDKGEVISSQANAHSIYAIVADPWALAGGKPNLSLKYNLHSHGYSYRSAYFGLNADPKLAPVESVRLKSMDGSQLKVEFQALPSGGESAPALAEEVLPISAMEGDWIVLSGDTFFLGLAFENALSHETNRFGIAEDGSLVARIDKYNAGTTWFFIPIYTHFRRWVRWQRINNAPAGANPPGAVLSPSTLPEQATKP